MPDLVIKNPKLVSWGITCSSDGVRRVVAEFYDEDGTVYEQFNQVVMSAPSLKAIPVKEPALTIRDKIKTLKEKLE